MTGIEAHRHTEGRLDYRLLTGRILSSLAAVILLLDAGAKLLFPSVMIEHSPPLGIPAETGFYRMLGATLVLSVGFYIWRRSSFLGAVLLTGYLGGAIAINLRASMPPSHSVFAVFLGLLVWGGLWLRDVRLRGLFA